MFNKIKSLILPALAIVAGLTLCGDLLAQTTPAEYVQTQIDAVAAEAQLVAEKGSTALVDVFQWAVIILITGMAVGFVWRFFNAGRARC